MYCNIVFMIDIFVISKITQYRYYVIAITDVRSLGLSTKWRTLMIKKTMKVRENTFRKLEDPFENGAAKKYVFYVKVDDVAEGIPMATNPRDQKLTSGVATAIKESLLSNDGYFHLKNRGIVLSAESVHYNNKEKIATIIFSDELSHGNIDGGHTYKIVCEHKGENLEQYVQFEVMTGVEDIIENLAEARNTSVQVDAKSMAELAEKFDPIKEGLEGMPFFKRIAFKQNQISVDDETGKKNKMIDAREIVAIISMFNISLYDALHHPTQAYSSKAKMLDMYLKNPEEYREYVNIIKSHKTDTPEYLFGEDNNSMIAILRNGKFVTDPIGTNVAIRFATPIIIKACGNAEGFFNMLTEDWCKFHAITFCGGNINALYTPGIAIEQPDVSELLKYDGARTIKMRPWSAYTRTTQFQIENEKVTLTVSIGQTAETNNAENRGAYNLGKVYTFFRFSFENAQGFEKMEKYYIIARKIVAILTSQNNICFEEVYLSQRNSEQKYFKTGICKIFDSYENYSIRQWHKVIPIFSVFDYIPNLIDGIVNGKVNSLLELLPEDNKMVNRISIKNVQDLCTALEVSYQLDDKRNQYL